jgi:hypothetical protein
LSVVGIVSATRFYGDGSTLTGIAATTNVLTNSLVVSGITTATGGIQVGATTSITVGDTFIRRGAVGLGTTSTTGRNAGVGTAVGTMIYNSTTGCIEAYNGTSWRTVANLLAISATGGTISTPGDGFTYHLFTSPGTFTVNQGTGTVTMVAIGAGGGGGGADGGTPGGGGGGGGAVIASFPITTAGSFTVSVGGGGGAGSNNVAGSGGGTAGTNGGGTGGNAGGGGSSGAGGGGGGWSGVTNGPTYYIVAGGAAGGGGGNEGTANDQAAFGGGSPSNSYNPSSLTGSNGTNYPGDGGGWGGSGGGYNGTGGGGGTGGTTQYGGSNYANPSATSSAGYGGGDGAFPANTTAGSRAPGFFPANPVWSPIIPASAGNGGAGNGGAGNGGAVAFRYPTS